MTDSATPAHAQTADGKPASDKKAGNNEAWWLLVLRVLRWLGALAFALLALRATGQETCHLTTTSLAGLPASSPLPRTQTTSTCTGVGFSDLIGYFLVIAVLLLPDAKSIGVGGFRFERLSSKVDEVSREVGALSQNLNQTFNIGANALDELRAGLRRQKADLDEVRDSLPDDERTLRELRVVDDVTKRSDDAAPPEIFRASMLAAALIEEAKRAAEEEVDRSAEVGAADVENAVDAQEVLARFQARWRRIVEAPDDEPGTDA